MIEGCWEETPRIPAFWLGFRLSQTPNPPSSPFLSPQAQQHRRDMEQVGAEEPSGQVAPAGRVSKEGCPAMTRL